MRVVGLMSGTSYDAVEATAADLTLGQETLVLRPLGVISLPYGADLRARIAGVLPPAATSAEDVCRLDTGVGRAFAGAAVRGPAPKSTGKEHFHLPYLLDALAPSPVPAGDRNDVLATLTRLTAVTVADACRALGVTELVVSGGGTRNPTLLRMIAEELPGVRLRSSDELGLPAMAKEALAFAVLGFLTVNGLPASLPSCTGARRPSLLGSITPGGAPLRLPEPASVPPRTLRILPTLG